MTVAFTMERMAEILEQLMAANGGPLSSNQLRTVFPTIQRVLQDADLPALCIFPRNATYDRNTFGASIVSELRNYDIDYVFSRADAGAVGDSQSSIELTITDIADFLLARPGLWDTTADQPEEVQFDSGLTGDTGYSDIKYAGVTYVGCRYQGRVHELRPINYVD